MLSAEYNTTTDTVIIHETELPTMGLSKISLYKGHQRAPPTLLTHWLLLDAVGGEGIFFRNYIQ